MHLKGYLGEALNKHREKSKTNNKRTVFDAGSPISQLKGSLPFEQAFQLKKKKEKKRGVTKSISPHSEITLTPLTCARQHVDSVSSW